MAIKRLAQTLGTIDYFVVRHFHEGAANGSRAFFFVGMDRSGFVAGIGFRRKTEKPAGAGF